jgi:hypothetical protein
VRQKEATVIRYNNQLAAVRQAEGYALVFTHQGRRRVLATGLTGAEVRCGFEYLRLRSAKLPPADRIAAIVRSCTG